MKKAHASVLATSRDRNLRLYCASGLGTAVLAGAVTTMDASPVFTNFSNTVLTDTTVGDTEPTDYELYLNPATGTFNVSSTNSGTGVQVANFFVDTEASGSTTNAAVVTAGVNGSTTSPLGVIGITAAGASSHVYNYPSRLAAGAAVGPTRTFVTLSGPASSLTAGSLAFGAGFTNSKWAKANKNSGYLGIDFTINGALHYGFIQMTVATNTSTTPAPRSITLIGAGYETVANTAITTVVQPAAVPEPSSLALLAAGGLGGIAAYRRRKQAAAKSVDA